MKILLTGARGFIGHFFYNAYKNIHEITPFSFVHDDFSSLHVKGIDVVIHLSALVHQMAGASDEAYEKINVEQTLLLAKKAKEAGVKHFIFMSTIKVYGEESVSAYDEDSPCIPLDPYGKSKYKAENLLMALCDEYFCVSIVRTPLVYGCGVKANMRNLMHLIERFSCLPLGGINNQRSLAFVGNVCALIETLIRRPLGGVFLAGDDEPLSTTDLMYAIAAAKNKPLFLFKMPLLGIVLQWLKPHFYQRLFGNLVVNNQKTKSLLAFKNPYSTHEGILAMVQKEAL